MDFVGQLAVSTVAGLVNSNGKKMPVVTVTCYHFPFKVDLNSYTDFLPHS